MSNTTVFVCHLDSPRSHRLSTLLHLLAAPESEPLPALAPLGVTAALLGVYSDVESAARAAHHTRPRERWVAVEHLGHRRPATAAARWRQLRAHPSRSTRRQRHRQLRRRSDPTKGVHSLREYLRGANRRRLLFARRTKKQR